MPRRLAMCLYVVPSRRVGVVNARTDRPNLYRYYVSGAGKQVGILLYVIFSSIDNITFAQNNVLKTVSTVRF